MDVRSGDHIMGDEFETRGPVQLKIIVHGTEPIARIDIIKDFKYAYSTEPHNGAGRVPVDRRRARADGRLELVLRESDPGRWRACLGEPDLGAYAGSGQVTCSTAGADKIMSFLQKQCREGLTARLVVSMYQISGLAVSAVRLILPRRHQRPAWRWARHSRVAR